MITRSALTLFALAVIELGTFLLAGPAVVVLLWVPVVAAALAYGFQLSRGELLSGLLGDRALSPETLTLSTSSAVPDRWRPPRLSPERTQLTVS